jgi:hypothetical protein
MYHILRGIFLEFLKKKEKPKQRIPYPKRCIAPTNKIIHPINVEKCSIKRHYLSEHVVNISQIIGKFDLYV